MTQSGPEVVAKLEAAAKQAAAEAATASSQQSDAEAAVRVIGEQLADRFFELATEFVPDLGNDTLVGVLATGRSDLTEIADRRDRRLRELQSRLQRLLDELRSREEDWQNADRESTAATDAFEAKRGEIERYLASDDDYQRMQRAIETTRTDLQADRDRLAEVNLDAEEKRPDYEADTLFRYLRDRHYGEADYAVSGLFARLDRRVARLIDYPALQASYRFLTEVPDLMSREIARRETELDALVDESLAAIRNAENRFGLPPLQREADRASQAVDQVVQRRDRTATQVEELSEQIDAIGRKEGGFYQQAIDRYAAVLTESGDQVLATAAGKTATITDDDLVADVRVLRGRLIDEQRAADETRTTAERARSRSEDLAFVARRARQSDLATPRARYLRSFDLDELLTLHEKQVIDRRRFFDRLKNEAEIDPTWSERAYNRTSDAVNSPTAQILIGTAAQAPVPLLTEALRRRR